MGPIQTRTHTVVHQDGFIVSVDLSVEYPDGTRKADSAPAELAEDAQLLASRIITKRDALLADVPF